MANVSQNFHKNDSDKEPISSLQKPYSYFVKDTAEFVQFAEFEPITNLTAAAAVQKYDALLRAGKNAGIGINIPGDRVFNDPNGVGITVLINYEGQNTLNIFGDTFIKELKENNQKSINRIAAYKELYQVAVDNKLHIENPQFLWEKEKDLNNLELSNQQRTNEKIENLLNKNELKEVAPRAFEQYLTDRIVAEPGHPDGWAVNSKHLVIWDKVLEKSVVSGGWLATETGIAKAKAKALEYAAKVTAIEKEYLETKYDYPTVYTSKIRSGRGTFTSHSIIAAYISNNTSSSFSIEGMLDSEVRGMTLPLNNFANENNLGDISTFAMKLAPVDERKTFSDVEFISKLSLITNQLDESIVVQLNGVKSQYAFAVDFADRHNLPCYLRNNEMAQEFAQQYSFVQLIENERDLIEQLNNKREMNISVSNEIPEQTLTFEKGIDLFIALCKKTVQIEVDSKFNFETNDKKYSNAEYQGFAEISGLLVFKIGDKIENIPYKQIKNIVLIEPQKKETLLKAKPINNEDISQESNSLKFIHENEISSLNDEKKQKTLFDDFNNWSRSGDGEFSEWFVAPNGERYFEYDFSTHEYKITQEDSWELYEPETTGMSFNEYAEDYIKRFILEQPESPLQMSWDSKTVATNYVLDKLKESGLEVIQDKKTFENILETENPFQKMAESFSNSKQIITSEEKILLNKALENTAAPLTNIIYSRENYVNLFNQGVLESPVETVNMGGNQFIRLCLPDRNNLMAAIFETITVPSIVLRKETIDVNTGSLKPVHVYGKSFINTDSNHNRVVESLIIFRDGKNILVSPHNKSIESFVEQIKMADEIIYVDKNISQSVATFIGKDGDSHVWHENNSFLPNMDKKSIPLNQHYHAENLLSIQNLISSGKLTEGKLEITKENFDKYFNIFNQNSRFSQNRNLIASVLYKSVSEENKLEMKQWLEDQNYILTKKYSFQAMTNSSGTTYGFAHDGKIYLNPETLNSNVAVHEYTHLWDKYTQNTNSELWQKGLDIFKDTKLWNEVKQDPNYADIAGDDDLVLSEVHSRITGKLAAQVLERIAQEDGEITKDKAIDWDKEVWTYIGNELLQEMGNDVKFSPLELREFLATPMKDLMNGRDISLKLSEQKKEFEPTILADGIIDYTAVKPKDIYKIKETNILNQELPSYLPHVDIRWQSNEIPAVKTGENEYLIKGTKDNHSSFISDYSKTQIFKVNLDVLAALEDYHTKYQRAVHKAVTSLGYEQINDALDKGETKTRITRLYRSDYPRTPQPFDVKTIDPSYLVTKLKNTHIQTPRISLPSEKARRVPAESIHWIEHILQENGRKAFSNRIETILDVKQKLLDMELQYADEESTYTKGKETSYGDSNINGKLLNTLGVNVKRQNGDLINSNEIKEIEKSLKSVYEVFGNFSGNAKEYGLKISHAGETRMHASKAIGMFVPMYNAIGVSNGCEKDGKGFFTTLAHESAHFIDNLRGEKHNAWHGSDIPGTTENKIAVAFRKEMTAAKGDYWNRTCECFARAMEEYAAIRILGEQEQISTMSAYCSKDKFTKSIEPLIDNLIVEYKKDLYKQLPQQLETEIIQEQKENNFSANIASNFEGKSFKQLDLFESIPGETASYKGLSKTTNEQKTVEYQSIDGNYTENFVIDPGKDKLNESLLNLKSHLNEEVKKERLSDFNEIVKKTFIEAIKTQKAPWLMANDGTQLPAHNPVKGTVFQKFNKIWLELNQSMMNSTDSRWITSREIYEHNFELKKDSNPVTITYAKKDKSGSYYTIYEQVYNGKDIVNLPPQVIKEQKQNTPIKTYHPYSMHPEDTLRADIVNYLNAQEKNAPFIPKGTSRIEQVAEFLSNSKNGVAFYVSKDATAISEKFLSSLNTHKDLSNQRKIAFERDE